MNRFCSSILSLALVLQPAFGSAELAKVGAAAAVAGLVQRENVPGGKAIGRLASGEPVYLDDHITSDPKGRLQVMLLDETVFTLGPNADMVIDKALYDPTTHDGEIRATVTKGAFRFVTGKVAANNPSKMKVKLGTVGTIGIRGTIVAGIVTPNLAAAMLAGPGAQNDANAKAGAFDLSNGMGTTRVSVAGEGSMVAGGASAPTPAAPLPASVVGDINAGLAVAPNPAAPAESQPSSGGSKQASASQQSGETTAAAEATSDETSGTSEVTQALNATAVQSSQDITKLTVGVPDGITTWDQLLAMASGPSGFYFNGHTAVNCPNCQSTLSGNPTQGSFQLYYDFTNKQLGGGGAFMGPSGITGSFVHLHGVYTQSNDVNVLVGGIPGDTVQQFLSSINYSSGFTGSAQNFNIPFSGAVSCNGGACANGDSFSGTKFTLQNANGIVAGQAVANLQYSNTAGKTATGSIVSPR